MKRSEKKEATRTLILRIAKAAFSAKPYDQVSVRDLAAAAGRSTGAIFAHFKGGKEALYREAMGRDPAGLDALAAFVDRVCVVCAGYPGDVGALSLEAQELRASIVRGG